MKAYLIHKTETSFKLCKVLNEYDTIEEINENLAKLLTHKTTERKLLKEFKIKKKEEEF